MKIALVSPYDYAFPGGVNEHISRLGESFTKMGHTVKIIAPCSRRHEVTENEKFIFLGRPIPIHASGSIVRAPVSPWLFFSHQVKNVLERECFDLIHVHEPLFPPLCTAVVHYSETMMVGTFHASRSRSWGYWFWKPICLQRWFEKLDGRIAVSRPAMEFASRYFPGDYAIIPNGVDVNHFSADVAPIEEYCDGKLNIMFVGRLEKRKGVGHLLKAYRRIKREFPRSRLIVVGPDGNLRRDYQMIVARWRLADVVFVGYVSDDDLPRYYKAADIFCAPAIGKESFGIVLLEAMAASKPIVASNIEGYANLISHGVNGLLVKPKDEKALAAALSQLLEDKALRERMGALGRQQVEDYSWERVAQRVMDYYQSLDLKGK